MYGKAYLTGTSYIWQGKLFWYLRLFKRNCFSPGLLFWSVLDPQNVTEVCKCAQLLFLCHCNLSLQITGGAGLNSVPVEQRKLIRL